MNFSIIDNNTGRVVWNTPAPITVTVTNGLFSVPISPTGVDWQNINAYLQVKVNGQALTPTRTDQFQRLLSDEPICC